MRRFLFWMLLVTGISMIFIGIAEAKVHPGALPVAHIVMSSIFVITVIFHLVINHKAVGKYLRGS